MKFSICFSLIIFIALPVQAQTVTGSVPSPVRELVMDMLSEAGIASAQIISRRRSTKQEAEFLYHVLQRSDNAAEIKQRFGPAVRKVIDRYLANKPKPRPFVLAAMDTEIRKQIGLLGENREEFAFVGPSKVHKFVVTPEPAIDYAGHLKRFETALQDHPDFSHWQGTVQSGGAFHVEIAKTLRTISGLWRGRCRETSADGEKFRYRHVMKLKRDNKGYSGMRKSPSLDSGQWIKSRLENLMIDRRTKKIAYAYKNEHGKQIKIAGRFNDEYNRIKFLINTSGAKCRLRKRF